jgi:hypothetical protein
MDHCLPTLVASRASAPTEYAMSVPGQKLSGQVPMYLKAAAAHL